MSGPALTLRGVSGGYGQLTVLHEIDAVVDEGKIVAVLGSNGAGKSTLLKTVVGLVRPKTGTILHGAHDLTGVPTEAIAREGVVLIPEGRQLFSSMTVMENLQLGGHMRRRRRGDREEALAAVFELFPILKERRKQTAGSMSGGEQQMLAIGRALMARPKVLLLDEPSLGLAPLVLAQVFEVLRVLRERGSTILIVEQNAMMTLELADSAYVLERGRVVAHGPAEQLRNDTRVRAAYLGLSMT
jgi:branched-chain amino acid transport system ATP-binding protein